VNLDLHKVSLEGNQEKYAEVYPEPFTEQGNRGAYESYKFISSKQIPIGKYLDIGCGNGALLYLAKNDGWQVEGLELFDFLANKIKETLDIDVFVKNFLDLDISDFHHKYDLISLRHVLEHLPNSLLALSNINKMLKPDAYALFEFPNIEAFSFKLKRFLSKKGIYSKKYAADWVPGHCNEFSIDPWKYLLDKTGFELVSWRTYSLKPFNNIVYGLFNTGNKVRTLVKKKQDLLPPI
jgi:2-polyprenyl-3-methyl-5-hydroxy-6-metoxy-1,4-benzoquinol methylase